MRRTYVFKPFVKSVFSIRLVGACSLLAHYILDNFIA